MILYKLKEIECDLIEKNDHDKLKTVKIIKNLLLQIDYTSEVIPDQNIITLKKLLTSLKGGTLSFFEKSLVEELYY